MSRSLLHHPAELFRGLQVTSLGTLASRVTGLLRDGVTAALLGVGGDGVMDALVVALRIPNLFRRLFGEGALTASYLPILTRELQRDRADAWKLVTATLTGVALLLSLVTLLGWGALALLAQGTLSVESRRLVELSALVWPYVFFICLAAQLSATLQALRHFATPALAPIGLNLVWIAVVLLVCPRLDSRDAQGVAIALGIVVAGGLQVAVQWVPLVRLGYRPQWDWPRVSEPFREMTRTWLPMAAGLAVTQVNAFVDALLAWGLSAPAGGGQWSLGSTWTFDYPLATGASSCLYLAERVYQFPIGLVGVATATVCFPWFSAQAARGDRAQLSADLQRGIQLVMFLAVPAAAGLILLGGPIASLLFERGAIDSTGAARVGRLLAAYGWGLPAMCVAPLMVRACYALGENRLPLRIATGSLLLNAGLNFALIAPAGEVGLALATSLTAWVQVARLTHAARSLLPREATWNLAGSWLRLAESTCLLAVVVLGGQLISDEAVTFGGAISLGLTILAGAASYLGWAAWRRFPEWQWLLPGPGPSAGAVFNPGKLVYTPLNPPAG